MLGHKNKIKLRGVVNEQREEEKDLLALEMKVLDCGERRQSLLMRRPGERGAAVSGRDRYKKKRPQESRVGQSRWLVLAVPGGPQILAAPAPWLGVENPPHA